jgi:hypothetical protein
MLPEYAQNWYGFEDFARIADLPERTLRRVVAGLQPGQVRTDASGVGRPRKLYHYSAHPALAAHWQARKAGGDPDAMARPQAKQALAPDDLTLAMLRLEAVQFYEQLSRVMAKEDAAVAVVRDFSRRPREKACIVEDRLPGNHRRERRKLLSLSRFSTSSLRGWKRAWDEGGHKIESLAPQRKGRSGRTSVWETGAIARDTQLFVLHLSQTTRGDIPAALEIARQHVPDLPRISLATWRRRMRELDPRECGRDLFHSVQRFRSNQSPDVEVAWDKLSYNERWEIDDRQLDWYVHGQDPKRILRPYAYSIIRCSTRQCVAFVTSECPITQEQVRTLVGVAMASPAGGVPGRIHFENGTVACDDELEWVLTQLGVEVGKISMDAGRVNALALPDVAKGHPQGHGLIERAHRRYHQLEAFQPGQVGGEERHSAPARTERLKKYAAECIARGETPVLPTAAEWHAIERQYMERSNNAPHSALPEIVLEDGSVRHMSPNERARSMQAEEVRVMPAEYLPLFYAKGERVPVTRNGIRLAKRTFGRFDEELLTLEHVTAYCSQEWPGAAYVAELGRMVEEYVEAAPGDYSQLEEKRRIERSARNLHEEAVLAVQSILKEGAVLVDVTQVTEDPTPQRRRVAVSIPELDRRVGALKSALADRTARAAELASRTSFSGDAAAPAARAPGRRRASLMAQAGRFGAFANATQQEEAAVCTSQEQPVV